MVGPRCWNSRARGPHLRRSEDMEKLPDFCRPRSRRPIPLDATTLEDLVRTVWHAVATGGVRDRFILEDAFRMEDVLRTEQARLHGEARAHGWSDSDVFED